MKKVLSIIFLITAILSVGCNSQDVASSWTEESIEVDGKSVDGKTSL